MPTPWITSRRSASHVTENSRSLTSEWRARCGESRTPGSEGGGWKSGRKANSLAAYPTVRHCDRRAEVRQLQRLVGQPGAPRPLLAVLRRGEGQAGGQEEGLLRQR